MSEKQEMIFQVKDLQTWFPITKGMFKKTVGHVKAIDGVSLDVYKGETLGIVGESGCGKSTLCKMILRLHTADMGTITLNGKDFADKKSYDPLQFKLDVQPIFQNPYESFSARKAVDTYLFNTALRLGIAKNKDEANKLGADAVINVRYGSSSVMQGAAEVIAYGTAVRYK